MPYLTIYHKNCPDGLAAAVADGVNVAEIAAQFGGGGHKHAAGFSVEKLAVLP